MSYFFIYFERKSSRESIKKRKLKMTYLGLKLICKIFARIAFYESCKTRVLRYKYIRETTDKNM